MGQEILESDGFPIRTSMAVRGCHHGAQKFAVGPVFGQHLEVFAGDPSSQVVYPSVEIFQSTNEIQTAGS